MGIIAKNVEDAFNLYKAGNLTGFINKLIDVADYNIHYEWHRAILNDEIRKQFKKLMKKGDINGILNKYKERQIYKR